MKDSTKVYLYTGGWCLYFLQGVFGERGSSLPVVLSIILVLVSFVYVFISQPICEIRRGKVPFLILSFDLFLLMLMSSKIGYAIEYGRVTDFMIKDFQIVLTTLLPVYFYYYYAKIGTLSESVLQRVALVFFAYLLVNYCYMYFDSSVRLGTGEITNNGGRILLTVVPMLLFVFEKKVRVLVILGLLVCVLVMLSAKREAIIVFLVEILSFFIWKIRNTSMRGKVKIYLELFVTVLVVFFVFYYLLENNTYFHKRVYDTMVGNVSGRDRLLPRLVYEYFVGSSELQFLIGRGTMKTWALVGNYAHNDVMELATCQGVVGLIFYFNLWIALFLFWKNQRDGIMKLVSFLLLIDFFFGSLFSRFYFSTYVVLFCMLGFILGTLQKEKLMDSEKK